MHGLFVIAFKRTAPTTLEKQTGANTFVLDEVESKLHLALAQAYKDEEPKAGTLMVQEKPSQLLAARSLKKGGLCLVPYTKNVTFVEKDSFKAAALTREKVKINMEVKLGPDCAAEVFIDRPSVPSNHTNLTPDDRTLAKLQIPYWMVGATFDTRKVNMVPSTLKVNKIEIPTLDLSQDVVAGTELLMAGRHKVEHERVADEDAKVEEKRERESDPQSGAKRARGGAPARGRRGRG